MVKTRDNDNKNYYSKFNRGSYSRGSSAWGRNRYYSRRGYLRNNGKYFQNYWNRVPPGHHSRPLSRPVSPVEGSEEFMARKIQQTSAIIMRQLLSPNEPEASSSPKTINTDMAENKDIRKTNNERMKPNESIKQNEKSPSKTKKISIKEINVQEIHEKILNRITNLNEGRKKNFINAQGSTSLDSAVQHIHKQKRLEISRVLRDMCSSSQNLQKSGDLINSFISDIEIKLEELPMDVIQELRQTLNIDLDEDVFHPDSPIDNSQISITSDELNAAIDSIQDITEQVDSVNYCDSIEIKAEDIVDFSLEDNASCGINENRTSPTVESTQETEQNQEEIIDPIHHSFTIKTSIKTEPTEEGTRECDSPGIFSQSTDLNRDEHRGPDRVEINELVSQPIDNEFESHDAGHTGIGITPIIDQEASVCSSSKTNSVSCLENCIRQFIDSNNLLDMSDYNEVFEIVESIEKCVSNLSEHGRNLMKAVLHHCDRTKNSEGGGASTKNARIFSDQSSQTDRNGVVLKDQDKRVTKKRKKDFSDLGQHLKAASDRCPRKNKKWKKIGISRNKTLSNNATKVCDQSSQAKVQTGECSVTSEDDDRRVTERRKKDLSDHGQNLMKTASDRCLENKNKKKIDISENETSINNARKVCDQSSQAEVQIIERSEIEDDDKRVTKRQKKEDCITQEIKEECEIKSESAEDKLLVFPKLNDQVMVIEKVDNRLVIATKAGNILYLSLIDGTILNRIDVSESPITSLLFLPWKTHSIAMYVGSLDRALRMYDFRSGKIRIATHVDDQIRCMDAMWDYVFIGCSGGMLMRYSTKRRKIEFEERNSSADILVLKAAQEGPRRVLLIGHKQAPVYVRDAMSGQYLRNFSNEAISPTVYALVVNKIHLFCGTAQNNILVFSFHEGTLLHRLVAADCKGISCMKIYQDLLFSGCYNGLIYVYHLKLKKQLTILKGPGGSISCMDILHNQVIVGTLKGEFGSVEIPALLYPYISAYGQHSTSA